MKQIEPGMLASSLAGHDCGKVYVIIRTEGEYVYLVDGIYKTFEKPKKKNKKHIQIIHCRPVQIKAESEDKNTTKNETIKKVIKEYKRCQ